MDQADRRFDLIAMVINAEALRGVGRRRPGLLVCLCQGDCDHLTRRPHGAIDREEITRELAQVKAEPGEYTEESYERWRLGGLPVWAAIAAGMKPAPGSRKLIGRRPDLPLHRSF
jgi:hypothetical protein